MKKNLKSSVDSKSHLKVRAGVRKVKGTGQGAFGLKDRAWPTKKGAK